MLQFYRAVVHVSEYQRLAECLTFLLISSAFHAYGVQSRIPVYTIAYDATAQEDCAAIQQPMVQCTQLTGRDRARG